jgi:hypothetical protein
MLSNDSDINLPGDVNLYDASRKNLRRIANKWISSTMVVDKESGAKLPRNKRRSILRNKHLTKTLVAALRVAANTPDDPILPVHRDDELPKIIGDTPFHDRVRTLVKKNAKIFSRKVKLQPAALSGMKLKFRNESAWRTRTNCRPARPVSTAKELALKEELRKLLAAGVIQESQATHYSQVLLVPKPNSKWRFCIDYRALNESLEGMGWPIPNIKHLITRIGAKEPLWFAVLDLTSGYHQVLLDPESRQAAAFITPFGLYEPVRISMGLKSAPSYFQQQMQSVVLSGLVGEICELYIDDIIIYGKTEEEFLANLERVFQRLKEFNVTINPDKAKIAVPQVEALGHVVDRYGISMSEEKIKKVMDFPLPKVGKDLKRFVGLANYFRSHIRSYSDISKPLDRLLENYQKIKNKVIAWTPEATAAFRTLQKCISECPKLYFVDHSLPVILETDASDYGIGAFLYQLRHDGDTEVREPIAFMSRTLQGAQKNWSTIEKECYSIFMALREWEYLLRDVSFTIRTDHKNLRYLNTNTPKVVRWKLAIQEFDFHVEYLAGPENVVADALSRIQRDDDTDTPCSDHDSAIRADPVLDVSTESREGGTRLPDGQASRLATSQVLEHPLVSAKSTAIVARLESRPTQVAFVSQSPAPCSHEQNAAETNKDFVADNKVTVEGQTPAAEDALTQPMTQSPADIEREIQEIQRGIEEDGPLLPAAHHHLRTPTAEQLRRIQNVHNAERGHFGRDKTLENLKKELPKDYKWPHMRSHVKSYIDHCPHCQKSKAAIPVAANKPFTTSTYHPMERVSVDAVGPFPTDQDGNAHIVVMIDNFTRFVELFAVPTLEMEDYARCLMQFTGRYGAPRVLLSDKGTQFCNSLIQYMLTHMGSIHLRTTAASKEENATVERVNRDVGDHIRAIVNEKRVQKNWSLLLPLVQRILNVTVKDSLGVSPAQLVFGNTMNLDRGLFFENDHIDIDEPASITPTVKVYLETLLKAQSAIIEIAQKNQLSADEAQLQRKEGKKRTRQQKIESLPIGSLVLAEYPPGLGNARRPPTKFHTKYQGPLRVAEVSGDMYTLQNLVTTKLSDHHISTIIPFKQGIHNCDPVEIALRDTNEFYVERIVAHRGDLTKKSTLMFKVRWLGYNERHDTWEPWRSLRAKDALHDYLREIGQEKLIPKEFIQQRGEERET